MLTVKVKLSVEDIIGSLEKLDHTDRIKLEKALFDLQEDAALQVSVNRGLADVENGRVTPHAEVMKELRLKHNL